MINEEDYDVYILDYEGTLSLPSTKILTLYELLYGFDFRDLLPNKKIYDFIKSLDNKEFYVVGVIETNTEIE